MLYRAVPGCFATEIDTYARYVLPRCPMEIGFSIEFLRSRNLSIADVKQQTSAKQRAVRESYTPSLESIAHRPDCFLIILTCIIHENLLQAAESLQYQLIGEFCPNYSL